MGVLDPSPIPPYAITCWEDEHNIYAALPMKAGGIPYIMKFARNEGGLAAALAVLSKHRRETIIPTHGSPANYTHPTHQPQIKLTKAQEKLHSETTEAQREHARRYLSKLGIK